MAAAGPTGLPQLFNELHRCCHNQEYPRVVQVANRILQDSPQDTDAFHCKVLALIHQSSFSDALVLINKNPLLSKDLIFEKAYAEYRLNRLEESLRSLQMSPATDSEPSRAETFRIKELEAQIYYRLERYEECLDLYKQLLKESEDDYEDERLTNVSAVAAALNIQENHELAKSVDGITRSSRGDPTFELCFNLAFTDLCQGNYKDAETHLRQAETICRQSYEDDPEALEEEMVVVRVQIAYVLQMQGRSNEANNIYNTVLKQRTSDPAILAVASNNIITLNRDQNIFDSKKKIKTATASSLAHKLLSKQHTAIALNHALILMYSGQGDACRKLVNTLMEKSKECEEELHLIMAASFLRDKMFSQAVTTLQDFVTLKKSQNQLEGCLRAALAHVQLHLQHGSIAHAIEALKSLGETQAFRPGVVATIVSLLKNMEDKDAAVDYLSAAIKYNKEKDSLDGAALEFLMRECASTMLGLGQNARAVSLLEDLRKHVPQDLRVLAQLITAYATIDPLKAQQVSKDLPSPDELAQGVNVDELEAHCFASGPKYSRKKEVEKGKDASPLPAGKSAAATELLQANLKKKRKRKGKLPKNVDPKVDPDPERWLPRKDRSTYKGRRRDKRKEGVGKGTQGGVGNTEGLDASKPSPVVAGAVPKLAPSPHAPSPPPQSGSGKGNTPQPQTQNTSAKASAGTARTQPKKQQTKKKKKGGW